MKKLNKLLAIFALLGVLATSTAVGLAGCDGKTADETPAAQNPDNGNSDSEDKDKDKDKDKDEDKDEVTACEHVDSDLDGVCDKCGEDAYGWDKFADESVGAIDDVAGEAVKVTEVVSIVDKEVEPDETTEDGKLKINLAFLADDHEVKAYNPAWSDGVYSLIRYTKIRNRTKQDVYDVEGNLIKEVTYTKSVQFDKDDTRGLELTAAAPGTLRLHVQNSSSGAAQQAIKLRDEGGNETVYNVPVAGGLLYEIVVDIPAAGNYKILRAMGTSVDLFYANFETCVEDSPIEEIKVASVGKDSFLVGQKLDLSDLVVNAVHQTSRRPSYVNGSELVIDSSKYDSTQAGEYEIGVSYTCEDGTFSTSFKVNVYSYDSLTVGFNKIMADTKSAANNTIYANHAVRQVYKAGEEFSSDGLSVTVSGTCGKLKKSFIFPAEDCTYSAVDLSTPGLKTVYVSYTANGLTKTRGFGVYVVPEYDLSNAQSVKLNVDATYGGRIGQLSEGQFNFKTIQQAMDFINYSNLPDSATKTLHLAAGKYTEKVEITCPNLTITGDGKDVTVIEWDALYGQLDESGFEHTTDSTATLNVRDTAVNFKMSKVTVNNAYCTQAYFDKIFGSGYSEHRALAVLIMADKVVVDDCVFNGYQDTIELFTGRQVIKNTLITGRTDFIFGTNNTTYFYNCEIRSIKSESSGGYVTAFKGMNRSDDDMITYGAIFDGCNFTAEAGVAANAYAMGRTWGPHAAVMVMNSSIGNHIAKDESLRYRDMNGKPQDAQFTEYNNTGAGALTASNNDVTILSAEQAARYANLTVIFDVSNGKLINYFDEVWVPTIDK